MQEPQQPGHTPGAFATQTAFSGTRADRFGNNSR